MSTLLRVGTKVRTTDRGARVHGRAPDKPEAVGTVRDHHRPYGRQSKDRTPPYYVTFENGEAAWYDASEVEPLRGGRSAAAPKPSSHHATTKTASGDRRVWAFLDGEPFSAMVKRGQEPAAAVTRSLKKRLGADVTLWPTGEVPGGFGYRAQWFDAKTDRFREARVEIWRL